LPDPSRRFGEAQKDFQSHQGHVTHVLPLATVRSLPLSNQKQKDQKVVVSARNDRNNSYEKLAPKQPNFTSLPEHFHEGFGQPARDHATQVCVRPVLSAVNNLANGPFDGKVKSGSSEIPLDETPGPSYKSPDSGPKKTWRSSRRGHSPRQECMVQKENICPAGTARVDKENKKVQQLNYLRKLPCAKDQPSQVLPFGTSGKHCSSGSIFIDPEFQDSPSQAFLEIVGMCERCEAGHVEAMAALKNLQRELRHCAGPMQGHCFR